MRDVRGEAVLPSRSPQRHRYARLVVSVLLACGFVAVFGTPEPDASNMCPRLPSLALLAILGLLVPGPTAAQVSCRPNIFGGQDCTSPEGRSSSMPNVFGGFDTTSPDGSRSSSHPNI